ncbi:DUF805 domain-containing protein [Deinococcus hopiensis]|uniref:Uncharacterized protein n=1 Tax=Deinococcus hopiensis KR-140 TaxID=695939 RepID=A0A1W1UTR9_9DEIO|nr:DUF805 domain-containing protein [Deinococcus hopiensis]SMB84440.1 hypothetical protein SAMN00790413_05134 [Deinococcus hopiensis KR-140]
MILVPFVGGVLLFVFLAMDILAGTNKWGANPKGIQLPQTQAWYAASQTGKQGEEDAPNGGHPMSVLRRPQNQG